MRLLINKFVNLFQIFKNRKKKAFTLVELLIVIGILAVLATIAIYIINPTEIFIQSRDSQRLSDLQTINKALDLYQSFGGTSVGDSNKVYVSLPSNNADCSDLGLPALSEGFTYACQTVANYRKTDGTGWIPVDFESVSSNVGSIFPSLPVDPINTANDYLYYIYIPGEKWYLSATIRSQKFSSLALNDGGSSSTRFEIGENEAMGNIVVAKVKQSCVGETLPCYTSLAAWEAAYGGVDFGSCSLGNLVCANKVAIAQMDGDWVSADTTAVTISGWVTSATNYIKIVGNNNTGTWNTNKYRLEIPVWTGEGIFVRVPYVTISHVQIKMNGSDTFSGIGLGSSATGETMDPGYDGAYSPANIWFQVDNCILKRSQGSGELIRMNASAGSKVFNNIIYAYGTGAGIKTRYASIAFIYNNTVLKANSGYGIVTEGYLKYLYLKNNISVHYSGTSSDYSFDATWSGGPILGMISDNNISSDATSPDGAAYQNKTVSFVSTTAESEDLHLSLSDVSAVDAGVDLSTDADLPFYTDIDGDTRSGIWDIGADERN